MKNSLSDQQEILDEANPPYPTKNRNVTDALCAKASLFLFFVVLLLFIIVLIFGKSFSVFHPKDTNGRHCGMNNSKIDHNERSNKTILNVQNGQLFCSDKCDGSIVFNRCVPKSINSLQTPISFKLIHDFLSYKRFIFISLIIISISIIPLLILSSNHPIQFMKISTMLVFIGSLFLIFKGVWVWNLKLIILSSILFLIDFYFIYHLFSKLHILEPIFNAAVNSMKGTHSSYLGPLILIFISIFSIIFAFFGVLYAFGLGQSTTTNGLLKAEKPQANFVTVIIFPIISFITTQFGHSWVSGAVSLSTINSFFKHSSLTFTSSLNTLFSFHFGTILFGSIVIYFLENISLFFQRIRSIYLNTNNHMVKFLCKFILRLSFCLTQLIGDISHLSRVFTAMKGESFWDGCKEAAVALKLDTVLQVELLLRDVFLGTKIIITAFSAILCYIYMSELKLLIPWIPIAEIPLLIYLTLGAVQVSICASTESVLICLFEDAKECNDGNYYAPKDIQKELKWFEEQIREKMGFSLK